MVSPSTAEGVDLPDDAFATAYASGIVSTFRPTRDLSEADRVVIRNEAGLIVRVVTAVRPAVQ